MLVKSAIEDSGLSRAQIARDAGLSEDAVWSWLKGARSPTPDSLRALADGLAKRSDRLRELAEALRAAAKEEG